MRGVIRTTLLSIVFLAASALLAYAFLVYQNNRTVPVADKQVLKAHLEKSTRWLVDNQDKILAEDNPVLWWMLSEAEKISGDSRLTSLSNKYLQAHPAVTAGVWAPLFDGNRMPHIDPDWLLVFPYYNQYFIYALHCADNLARDSEIIRQQNAAGFCHHYPYSVRPACTTHQLLGIYFLRRQACGKVDDTTAVERRLQQDVVRQLTWDVRLVDVYFQRVTMLVITGARDKVKPVWIQRILAVQRDDGGWSDFEPLIPVAGRTSLGFSSRIIALGSPASAFHTTVQMVYLLTVLSKD